MKSWLQDIEENTGWICTRVKPASKAGQRRALIYAYPLKAFMAELSIPHGITKAEADKLCQFIKTLVNEDAA